MKHRILTTILILQFLVTACSATQSTRTAITQAPPTATTTIQFSRPTLIANPTETMIPVTLTIPASSKTPTAVPPVSTLSVAGAKSLILELTKDNGGCELPCLWGLTPGSTSSHELDIFTTQFGIVGETNISLHTSNYEDGGIISFNFSEDISGIGIDFMYSKGNDETERLVMQSRSVTGEIGQEEYDFGREDYIQLLKYYELPQILVNYGSPSRVLIAQFIDDPDYPPAKWLPFMILIIYEERGFIVKYTAPRETVGNNFAGCPTKAHVEVYTWNKDYKYSLETAAPEIGSSWIDVSDIEGYFKPIDEAAGLTINDFYQKFKEQQNTDCIETPIDMWMP